MQCRLQGIRKAKESTTHQSSFLQRSAAERSCEIRKLKILIGHYGNALVLPQAAGAPGNDELVFQRVAITRTFAN